MTDYEYIDDVATADIAFRARGKTPQEVFIAAVDATLNVMFDDLETISSKIKKKVALEDAALDMLLFQFLQEVIYHKDAGRLLLRARQVRIMPGKDCFALQAVLVGEELEAKKHKPLVDVKAVTLHRLEVKEVPGGWEAFVVLDI